MEIPGNRRKPGSVTTHLPSASTGRLRCIHRPVTPGISSCQNQASCNNQQQFQNHITACIRTCKAGWLSTALGTRGGGRPLLATPFWGRSGHTRAWEPQRQRRSLLSSPRLTQHLHGSLGQSPQVQIKRFAGLVKYQKKK